MIGPSGGDDSERIQKEIDRKARQRVLESIKAQVVNRYPSHFVVEYHEDIITQQVFFAVKAKLWAETLEKKTVKTYVTWWDHWKDTHLWFTVLFRLRPPRIVTHMLKTYAVYPTLSLNKEVHDAVIHEVDEIILEED